MPTLSRASRMLLKQIEDGFPGLHLFHTPSCGTGAVVTVRVNGREFDTVGGAQCPLEYQFIGCSPQALKKAIAELESLKLVVFERASQKSGWIHGRLPPPPKEPRKARSPNLPKELARSPSPRLRFEVFQRDGFACRYCGRKAPEVELEADHVKPYSMGGLTVIENLVTACVSCNAGKSARLL